MSYYKGHTEQSFGPLNTERLQFQGSDNSYQRTQRENFYIDIYKVTKTDEQLDKIVTVSPGYGCSSYLVKKGSNQWIDPPNMVRYSFRYISKVYNEGIEKSITQNEVFVSNNLNIVGLKTISQSITTEALYDYTLGIYYTEKEKGKCSILPIGPGSLGLDEDNRLSSDLVLNYHDVDKYNYVGKVFLNSESSYEAHVWETVLNHYQIGGKSYDKVVNTQYFVSSPDSELFRGFVLVRTTLNGLAKSSNGQYELVDSTRIDYFNLEAKSSDGDFESNLLMRLSDCFPNESKKTFAFHLECDKCKDADKCVKLAASEYPVFLGTTRNFFRSSTISVSRLADIDFIFQDKKMVILITFLDVPDMKVAVRSENIKLSQNTISNTQKKIEVESESECLQTQAILNYDDPEVILYCEDSGSRICGRFMKKEDIKKDEDKGINCKVYYPLVGIRNFARETPLNQVEEFLNSRKLRVSSYDREVGSCDFRSYQVTDVTDQNYQTKEPFKQALVGAKFSQNIVDVIQAKEVSNLGDCYRTCAHDEDNLCETFVFCQYPDSVSCLTSNIIFSTNLGVSTDLVADPSCKIYSKNNLLDYIKIPSRKFTNPSSIAIDVQAGDCATACSSSNECLSFQECGYSCTFGGYYTDSMSTKSDDCNIYIPKVSHKFAFNGKRIISDVFHTKINLNLDQCAALCHSWTNADESCKSFNYCPQNNATSSCSLTKYSIKDKSIKISDSNVCQNYELKQKSKKSKNEDQIMINGGMNGKTAFGLIILFMTIGLLIGFAFPLFIYGKLSTSITQRISSSEQATKSFTWSKQVDDVDEKSVI
ncbi:uncharacterized protein LOC128390933 isoform X1 [Panonychus citri]|uniref:uncharacterized protein LOC128390933 isoform X1 n=1 Tax=Panonychus citri TaxID=50023 RepID=UPI002307031F|nr:uncharacterized protein LOC128390933 isoform X1 [Panonychus citri]